MSIILGMPHRQDNYGNMNTCTKAHSLSPQYTYTPTIIDIVPDARINNAIDSSQLCIDLQAEVREGSGLSLLHILCKYTLCNYSH